MGVDSAKKEALSDYDLFNKISRNSWFTFLAFFKVVQEFYFREILFPHYCNELLNNQAPSLK